MDPTITVLGSKITSQLEALQQGKTANSVIVILVVPAVCEPSRNLETAGPSESLSDEIAALNRAGYHL